MRRRKQQNAGDAGRVATKPGQAAEARAAGAKRRGGDRQVNWWVKWRLNNPLGRSGFRGAELAVSALTRIPSHTAGQVKTPARLSRCSACRVWAGWAGWWNAAATCSVCSASILRNREIADVAGGLMPPALARPGDGAGRFKGGIWVTEPDGWAGFAALI